jgi:hypothetical protein
LTKADVVVLLLDDGSIAVVEVERLESTRDIGVELKTVGRSPEKKIVFASLVLP